MPAANPTSDPVRIGIVSISDRASSGAYEDKGLPALQDWLGRALRNPLQFEPRLIPDEQARISATLAPAESCGPSSAAPTWTLERYVQDEKNPATAPPASITPKVVCNRPVARF